MANVDPGLASIILDSVGDDDFEHFGQAILRQALGFEFQPTGGMHDGGQDGFLQPLAGRPTHYAQISTRADFERKIRQTIKRQRESGREVDALTYLTNRAIPDRDIIQSEIEKSTGANVRIFDKRWITVQIQRDERASHIFVDSFSGAFQSAVQLNEHISQVYSPSERMSILSYMEVHAASEPDEKELLPLAVDSAIYLSLEGTDPEKEIFKSIEEIIEFVEKKFPAAKGRKSIDLPDRVKRLTSKQGTPRIRYHAKFNGYCLPYEVRSEFSEHGQRIRASEVAFWDSMKRRLSDDGVSEEYLESRSGEKPLRLQSDTGFSHRLAW